MTSPTTVQVRLQIRADTAANWTASNPVLLANELGRETDTGKFKIGNGSTAWSSLSYQPWSQLTYPIVNADIASNAEIAVSKLADGSARQLLQTDAAGTGVEWASNIDIPGTLDVTGAATFDNNVTVQGDLTVNGTTTTIDTTTLVVEDKNIEIGNVAVPDDTTADGGGITLKGSTDKTINWIDATDAWTFSEHVDLAAAKEYRIAGVKVLDGTSLGSAVVSSSLTSVGTIGTGTWQGTAIDAAYLDPTVVTTSDTGTVTSTMILDGTIANGDINASAAIAFSKLASLSSANILVGSSGNVAASVAVTGDVTISNTGVTAIGSAVIVNADISATAEIAVSKLADGSARQLLQTDAAGTGVEWTSNVDIPGTLDVTGATTLDSTVSVPLGTAGAPTIHFGTDTNTGIYSPGADQVAISTNGTGRLFVDSTGQVRLTNGNVFTASDNTGVLALYGGGAFNGGAGIIVYGSANATDANVTRFVNGSFSERMRLDSSGRLGLGTSSPAQLLSITTAVGDDGIVLTNSSTSGGRVRLNSTGTGGRNYHIVSTADGSGAGGGKFCIFDSTASDAVRLVINSAGNVGIGTTSPGANLDIAGATFANIFLTDIAAGASGAIYGDGGAIDLRVNNSTDNAFTVTTGSQRFRVSGSEVARIDSSGRLLVGTSTSAAYGLEGKVQIAGTTDAHMSLVRHTDNAFTPTFNFVKSRGTIGSPTIVNVNDQLGTINFAGYDGTDYTSFAALIKSEVDGTPGTNDMPGRLVFSTTADGAASPTERLRITSAGVLQVADAGNITVGTTTGTKIGTATTQKLGFYNATPVVQPAAVADATTAIDVITQLNDLLAKLRTLGIIAT